MRTIKFRGKRVDNGEWVYSMTISHGTIKRKRDKVFFEVDENKWVGVIPETVGQFTGLFDKNGKDIYENDIVRYDDTPYNAYGRIKEGIIVYHRGTFVLKHYIEGCYYADSNNPAPLYYSLHCEDFFGIKSEVLGNVFDNPKLLTKK